MSAGLRRRPGHPAPGGAVPPPAATGHVPADELPAPDAAAGDDLTSAPRRVPVRLPGGLFDDSVPAAEHLLRVPGVVLVVDGYNVSMTGWPELSVADQRRRLVTTLSEAAARTATQVEIVFDGADIDPVPVPVAARRLVHVQFSPPGVEADDVVLDLVAQLPSVRPVVVASSDRRVREGSRRLGANVVHAQQLVDTLRR